MPSDRSFQLLEVVPNRIENSPVVGRRNWPDETKARIVEEALAPDVNVSAIARRYGMSPSQLFGWRRKAIAKGQVERHERLGEDSGTSGGVIEIGIAGATVRVGPAVSEDHLRRVIRAIRSA
ncbi:transposase [Devosia sp. RR2S18]|uniref:transposase n=1 Tax=Devosia rhizosphaerae TaxID=3049774 RepID=UPI0025418686|nr:transposase [Devosia sp. RR2S18]WIJ24004.1 transposase [Devosia sp. RR2S18]